MPILLALFLAAAAAAQNSGPARDAWQQPDRVMNALGVHAGSLVADVGCGAGYFVFKLALRAGPQGRVYAEDVLQYRLDQVRSEAQREHLPQIVVVHGSADNPHLPAGRVDAVLAVNTFHEWHDYESMLKGVYAALKPGGVFGDIDGAARPGLPRTYYYARHRMPKELERADITRAGFQFVREEKGFTRTNDGENFYFLIFRKPASGY